ncbi:MAG TPA: DUF1993 domain-containing protein [Vineibacter sp.]|nr:DUF1993 domain-containing protein [Vineibacter sp.]
MALSLYDLSVPTFLQTLGGVEGFLGRGLAHCQEKGTDPNEIVESRLFADMLPFRFQIVAVAHHSLGAMRGVKEGVFGPPASVPPLDYAGLQRMVREAREALEKLSPDEVNALDGKDVIFQLKDMKLPFIAAEFLLSFSLPNFHFHATTAYDILRMKGVPLGKRDYLGKMRMKR